jgi:hypothetical protein
MNQMNHHVVMYPPKGGVAFKSVLQAAYAVWNARSDTFVIMAGTRAGKPVIVRRDLNTSAHEIIITEAQAPLLEVADAPTFDKPQWGSIVRRAAQAPQEPLPTFEQWCACANAEQLGLVEAAGQGQPVGVQMRACSRSEASMLLVTLRALGWTVMTGALHVPDGTTLRSILAHDPWADEGDAAAAAELRLTRPYNASRILDVIEPRSSAESKEVESKEVESKEVESKEVQSKEAESKEVQSKEAGNNNNYIYVVTRYGCNSGAHDMWIPQSKLFAHYDAAYAYFLSVSPPLEDPENKATKTVFMDRQEYEAKRDAHVDYIIIENRVQEAGYLDGDGYCAKRPVGAAFAATKIEK